MNKYSMANFILYNLEYTSTDNHIASVQKWIDLVKPKYNSNPLAGSYKRYKQDKDAIEKMRTTALGKTHSELVKFSTSDNRIKENNPFYKKKAYCKCFTKVKGYG